jgi:hypothetical protein
MSPDLEKQLEDHQFIVVTRHPGEGARSLAQKLLRAMKLKTETGLSIKTQPRQGGRKIIVTVPGVLLYAPEGRVLLTASRIPAEIATLLNQPDLKIYKYEIINQT